MNGILLINKDKGVTSRDIVNKAVKKLQTKKIGHTGTLDPIATGVMVLCVGKATKLVDLLTSNDKEYLAEVTLGIQTDTLDITGNVLKEENVTITEKQIMDVLKTFKGKYDQEVPIYSAVRINGKKLYEYARNNEQIKLPKREVNIKEIEFLKLYNDNGTLKFTFKCLVSKGTYIRSLIFDICNKLKVLGTMSNLTRTKQGKFKIEDCLNINDISEFDLIGITDILDIPKVPVDNYLQSKILNGQILDNIYNSEKILFVNNENDALAIYQVYEKNNNKIKPYIMLSSK